MKRLTIAVLALSLSGAALTTSGCVAFLQRTVPPKECRVPVFVDGEFTVCLDRHETQKLLRRISPYAE